MESTDLLPFPLALCFSEYENETNPYLQLHRLTDAAEMLTRFLTIVALNDVLRIKREFPDKLREELAKKIERPTFGGWKDLLRVAVALGEKDPKTTPFIECLPNYVKEVLLPLLGGNDSSPEHRIIPLRNLLAHQGRLSNKQASELLAKHRTSFYRLFQELDFLDEYDLIACSDRASLVHLRGMPREDGSFPAYTMSTGPVMFSPEFVYLVHQNTALNLFPLQIFGPVLNWHDDLSEPESLVDAAPQIYFRLGRKGQLDFTPLTDKALFAHRRGGAIESFNEIFRLEEWRKTIAERKGINNSAFDDLLSELTGVFVGREKDLAATKKKLEQTGNGVIWISGRPGIGKSALMAKLILNYRNSPHHVVIPYVFRLGYLGNSIDGFLKAALARLYEALNQPVHMGAHVEERRALFINRVREAGRTLKQKVLFLIDGVDEIYRLDSSFISLLFDAGGDGVVWLCAGRDDPPEMEETLRLQGAQWVFPDGLPILDEIGIRTMLIGHLDRCKYPLLRRDKQTTRLITGTTLSTGDDSELEWTNEFVDMLTRRSEGLPLFVRMAINDLENGNLSINDEKELPQGLAGYYDQILQRLKTGSLGSILAMILGHLVWAKEPVSESSLKILISGHHLSKSSDWEEIFALALACGHLLLRQERTPEGESGWTLYHDSLRQYLSNSSEIRPDREFAKDSWLAWCGQWRTIDEKGLKHYSLRHYCFHLFDALEWEQLFSLARDYQFRRMQEQSFPDNPDTTLYPLRLALEAALRMDDATSTGEFMIKHADRVEELRNESPLHALHLGNLERALELADLQDTETQIALYLILTWELRENGSVGETEQVLSRLSKKNLVSLSKDDSQYLLLFHVMDILKVHLHEIHPLLDIYRLKDLSTKLTNNDLLDEALFVAGQINDTDWKERALTEIVASLVKMRNFERASQVIDQMSPGWARTQCQIKIAAGFAEVGAYDQALQAAYKISNQGRHVLIHHRIDAYIAIALEMARAGDSGRAQLVLELALSTTAQKGFSSDGRETIDILIGMIEIGGFERALGISRKIARGKFTNKYYSKLQKQSWKGTMAKMGGLSCSSPSC